MRLWRAAREVVIGSPNADESAEKPRGRPFVSGDERANRAGRPRGSRCRALRVLDQIGDENAQQILAAVVKKAKQGDMRAAEIILSRAWPQRHGRPVRFDMPSITTPPDIVAAISSLLQQVAAGSLTTEEAATVVTLLDGLRRSHEATILEQRVSALEAAEQRGEP
jgi:hypothetical protein